MAIKFFYVCQLNLLTQAAYDPTPYTSQYLTQGPSTNIVTSNISHEETSLPISWSIINPGMTAAANDNAASSKAMMNLRATYPFPARSFQTRANIKRVLLNV